MKRESLRLFLAVWAVFGVGMIYSETMNLPKKLSLDLPVSVLYQRDGTSSLTELRILLPAGMRSVPESLRGLSLLTARLALEIPSAQQVKKLLEMGSRFSSWATADHAVLTLTSLSSHFDDTLEIFCSILKKPLVTGIRIKRIKDWMDTRSKTAQDSPEEMMQLYYRNHFLRGRGYAGSVYGTKVTRKRISATHVRRLMEHRYSLRHMCVSIVSDLEETQIKRLLNQKLQGIRSGIDEASVPFSDLKEPEPQASPVKPDEMDDRELEQPLLAWGYGLPGLNDHGYACSRLLARWLARGIGSKAWALRSRDALAYTVDAALSQFVAGGTLILFIRTGPDRKDQAEAAMDKILASALEQGIPPMELEVIRRLELVAWLRGLQSKGERAWRMAEFFCNGLGVERIMAFNQLLSVTPEEVNKFARQWLSLEQGKKWAMGVPSRPSE